jgi:sporulation protein YlmC with PRC-barrel domain
MITRNDVQQVFGADVYASEGDKIGSVVQVYLDGQSGAPEWVSVRTSLFGMKQAFVPLDRATLTGDRLDVPFGKEQVKDAPRIDADGEELSPTDEEELYGYYGRFSSDGQRSGNMRQDGQIERSAGYDTSGPMTDDAMTRSEEHLVAGTRTEQAGTARLRKYVVTEQVQQTVPVRREEVRVEREPITDGNVD